MKKRTLSFILMLLLIAFSSVSVFAATSDVPRIIDNDGLLNASEKGSLESRFKQLSSSMDMDVVVATVPEIPGYYSQFGDSAARRYAHDFYEDQGLAEDGILLLFCKSGGDLAFSTAGKGISVFNDASFEAIFNYIAGDLRAEKYNSAFVKFSEKAVDYYNDYAQKTGEQPFRFGLWAAISAALGGIVGAIRGGTLKSQLKSVYKKDEAHQYIKKGSFVLNRKFDIPTYREVVRTKIERDQGTTTELSSSGKEHGGANFKI